MRPHRQSMLGTSKTIIKGNFMQKLLFALLITIGLSFNAYAAVDLNTASKQELESLKGVGPAKADAIIEYRKKSGGFKSVSDLDNVPGFGAKTVESLKKDVTVGNAKAAAAGTPEKTVKAEKK